MPGDCTVCVDAVGLCAASSTQAKLLTIIRFQVVALHQRTGPSPKALLSTPAYLQLHSRVADGRGSCDLHTLDPYDPTQGQWVHGVVDEVQRDRDTGILTLIEHKTRKRPSLPSAPQQTTARLQASIYRSLLEDLQFMTPAQVSTTPCAVRTWVTAEGATPQNCRNVRNHESYTPNHFGCPNQPHLPRALPRILK